MAIVKVDERRRMTIPKEVGIKGDKAIVIPAGSFFITIPLPAKPYEYASSWLPSKCERRELKTLAEKSAFEDAIKRAKEEKTKLMIETNLLYAFIKKDNWLKSIVNKIIKEIVNGEFGVVCVF